MDQTSADRVRDQIEPHSLLPVDTSVPLLPHSTASVVSVMDSKEMQVAVVR